MAVLVISIVLVAAFYAKLPTEVAYRFSGGEPVDFTGRGVAVAVALVLQFVFAALSLTIAGLATLATRRTQAPETALNRMLFTVMGNLMGLPQIIFAYTMLDIFLYNIYQVRLLPVWIFTVLVLALGAIVLAIIFIRAIGQSRRLTR